MSDDYGWSSESINYTAEQVTRIMWLLSHNKHSIAKVVACLWEEERRHPLRDNVVMWVRLIENIETQMKEGCETAQGYFDHIKSLGHYAKKL